MSPKILVVSDNCPSCLAVKRHLERNGLIDRFRVVNVKTEEGQFLIEKLDLMGVPDCVIIDEEKKVVRRCSDDEWEDMLEGE